MLSVTTIDHWDNGDMRLRTRQRNTTHLLRHIWRADEAGVADVCFCFLELFLVEGAGDGGSLSVGMLLSLDGELESSSLANSTSPRSVSLREVFVILRMTNTERYSLFAALNWQVAIRVTLR